MTKILLQLAFLDKSVPVVRVVRVEEEEEEEDNDGADDDDDEDELVLLLPGNPFGKFNVDLFLPALIAA